MQRVFIKIKDKDVLCRLSFSRRAKYLRIQVSSIKGLEIIVPYGFNSSKILDFVKEHENWIEKKLSKQKKEIAYLGKKINLIKNVVPDSKNNYNLELGGEALKITGSFNGNINLVFLYEQWLFLAAKDYLIPRTISQAKINGFRINNVSVRRQTSRWGSCSRKGNISLNYKLLKYPEEVIDYVIFHELCHLKEMNHSENFWRILSTYVPNYMELRKKLKAID